MTFIIFISFFITLVLTIFKYKKSAVTFLIISIIMFWGTGSGLLGRWLLSPLQANIIYDPLITWKKDNAIVVLGAGISNPIQNVIFPGIMSYARLNTAAMLYFDCKKSQNKCTLILSGGDPNDLGISESSLYQRYLLRLNIEPGDIIIENKSNNTFQNAQLSSEILKAHPFQQLFLITDSFHLRRALLYFSHFGLKPIPIPAGYTTSFYSLLPNGYNFAIADYAMHEQVGIARYYFYNFLGWNK